MPAFEGVGGKNKKRKRNPTTSIGIALSQSLQLEETDALQSSALAGTLRIDQNSLTGLNLIENNQEPTNFYEDIQNIGPDNLRFLSNTPQVASLLEYLQTEDYKRKKLEEEKNWGEVFDKACNCNNTRLRRVALVDILS
ncbi:hypothetical protein PSHT_10397 [Puccinia striiformis]|uniref:Uncharacterized protein n=1 Tax=Puccinia striiformis TaxID=27350 RepID=A0A2S4V9V8_9BASI|nr:hypothetical protein PSHT_10397 [Puccinia striiformis]